MKTATGLALVAIGAILAFAVNGHPAWLNVQVVGWVLIIIGLAGMFVPRRGYGWLRKRIVVRPRTSAAVSRRAVATAPGTVVLTDEAEDEALTSAALLPGRTISKAEAEELGFGEPVSRSEVIEEFRPE
jgi:ABC-type transport system involved in cytochrome bd biosynthesis fused ATPase/permease subunit